MASISVSKNDEADCKRNRRELVESMQPARRMNIVQGDSEDKAPNQQAREAEPVCPVAVLPATEYMIALVDRFQKRFEMLDGPGFFRGRHEYKRQGRAAKAPFQCSAEAVTID